jgi:two-component system, NtrC family, response regulator AtoC
LRDLTKAKNAEMKILGTQKRLELALKGGDLGWWEWSIQTEEAFADERSAEILGYLPHEMKSVEKLWELIHPDDKPRVQNVLTNYIEGTTASFESEHRVETKSGKWKWVFVRGKIVERDQMSKPVLMAGTFQDITNLKLAEEALRQSEQQFRAIFEGAEDPIFLKDWSLRYIQVNPAFEKLAGIPASEIIGKRHENVFGAEAAEFIRDMELRALEGETVEDEHSKTVRGIPMSFLATRTPLRKASGEISGVLTILHDITDRKRGEISPVSIEKEYSSSAMRSTLKQAQMAAQTSFTILLIGESGSGKDYLAKYIHNHSDRVNGPYFSINCAAIAAELAESELFGHEKGAFTGAAGKKRGLLELAEGGTLLLNEIGDLSLALQAKLLTFLDTKKFTRVGGEREISVSARLITATNKDLEKEVESGNFRKDLFYRINVMSIEVPPLRHRREDIPMLCKQLLSKLDPELGPKPPLRMEPEIMDALKKYDWPGNVRELRNVLERALILSNGKKMNLSSLEIRCNESRDDVASFCATFPSDKSLNEVTQDLKRFLVNEALQRSGGSRQGAAKLLGISRYSLKHYIRSLGLHDDQTAE